MVTRTILRVYRTTGLPAHSQRSFQLQFDRWPRCHCPKPTAHMPIETAFHNAASPNVSQSMKNKTDKQHSVGKGAG
ncbi:hypothetical protein SCLCIDRAFT_1206909 [Scleroderma citrinum Foug A]|uniref:Uncharacterized protein n=1 Tax=Scleroderma citrinum Foug A TaxID=1036808 RepID=A0A0C3B0F9_9AGAM|nr:hypothetical protein SCLCIDRAFT_1206909 [Scleroderma citrinum Foug A]